MKGLVKWFSSDKGYGFITSDSGLDHYFNVRSVVGAELPANGDSVDFESKSGNKGPRAVSVKITGRAAKKNHFERPRDDRVNCPNCNKKIVPRMITYRGEPDKSVCPYCAATVQNFRSNIIAYIVLGFVVMFILFIATN
ncbi:cold-shock protein [Vibrio rotiferianus]|uniref:cold-shock protein n=1 Tax=Vibrio rotiferianus TaxID=190895 RepID=UPI0014872A62